MKKLRNTKAELKKALLVKKLCKLFDKDTISILSIHKYK